MKYFLVLVFIASLLASCNYSRYKETEYDIYSSVLDKKFGHLTSNTLYTIGIDDTLRGFKNELETVIYSIQNNDQFFNEYCEGDSSFKKFLLNIKIINSDKEIVDFKKLISKTKIKVKINKLLKIEPLQDRIHFSKIILNSAKNKGALFISGNSSGTFILVELTNKGWAIKHEIQLWDI